MSTAATHPVPVDHPLRHGERLASGEYERRYDAQPHLRRVELLEGLVHMPSPLRTEQHARPQSLLNKSMVLYEISTPGVEVLAGPTLRLDEDNRPEPDLVMRLREGGRSTVDEDGYLAGSPELIAEIAAASKDIDTGVKKHVYRRNGVREYLVWRTEDGVLDWFYLNEGRYDALQPNDAGLLQSTIYPGLWLDRDALLRADTDTILARLRDGLARVWLQIGAWG